MRCVLLWTHLFLLLLLFIVVDSRGVISLEHCQDRCGNVLIPYPFGIGKGCYLDEWFEIQCNSSTSGDLVPYLPKINKQVVGIHLPKYEFFPYGSLRVLNNITSTGCSSSDVGIKFGEPLNLTGTPFTIGRSNKLVAVGCNNMATLTNLEPRVVGCTSSCISRMEYDKSRCDGYRCCKADTPEEIGHVIGVGIQDNPSSSGTSNITRRGRCRVAFLSDETEEYPRVYPMDIATDPHWFYVKRYATIQLRWVIPDLHDSFIKSLPCDDHPDLDNDNPSFPCECFSFFTGNNETYREWLCRCKNGYTGNPYLLDGCRDIDECELHKGYKQSTLNYEPYEQRIFNCSETETCVNTPGSFRCVIKKNKTLPVTIGLSVGFGVLIATAVSFEREEILGTWRSAGTSLKVVPTRRQ